MHVLVVDIQHQGCSLAQTSQRFPRVEFLLRTPMSVDGRAAGVLAARADTPEEIDGIDDAYRNEAVAERPIMLLRYANMAFWQILSPEGPSIISAISRHRGFPLESVRVKDGTETWKIGLPDRDQAKSLVESLSGMGPLKVVSLSKGTFPDLRLTEAQARVLRAAVAGGYYEFPRRTSPTKLAKQLKLAKSTVIEHLQRAEAKVILTGEWLSYRPPRED